MLAQLAFQLDAPRDVEQGQQQGVLGRFGQAQLEAQVARVSFLVSDENVSGGALTAFSEGDEVGEEGLGLERGKPSGEAAIQGDWGAEVQQGFGRGVVEFPRDRPEDVPGALDGFVAGAHGAFAGGFFYGFHETGRPARDESGTGHVKRGLPKEGLGLRQCGQDRQVVRIGFGRGDQGLDALSE